MKKWLWILGGGAMQKFVLDEAKKMDYSTIVSDRNIDCLINRHEMADLFLQTDPGDKEESVRQLKKFVEIGYDVDGVVAAGIDTPVTASAMQDVLGKPAASEEAAEICHRKDLFRECLEYPRHVAVNGSYPIERARDILGQFVIVKNTDSSGSRGTTRMNLELTSQAEFDMAIEQAIRVSKCQKALIETLLVGTEHTVEAIFDVKGEFRPCFITDRFFNYGPLEGMGRNDVAMELGLCHPTALSKEKQDLCYKVARLAAEKIGIKHGTVKCDMMYASVGPVILEMTTRSSGGFDVQWLVPQSTGKNVLKVIVDTACGREIDPVDLTPKITKFGQSQTKWLIPGKRIKKISLNGEEVDVELICSDDPPWMAWWKVKAGDIVPDMINCASRPNILMAVSDNPVTTMKILEHIENAIEVEYER